MKRTAEQKERDKQMRVEVRGLIKEAKKRRLNRLHTALCNGLHGWGKEPEDSDLAPIQDAELRTRILAWFKTLPRIVSSSATFAGTTYNGVTYDDRGFDTNGVHIDEVMTREEMQPGGQTL